MRIHFLFMTAAGSQYALQEKSGHATTLDFVNEALYMYQRANYAQKNDEFFVAINTDNDECTPLPISMKDEEREPATGSINLPDYIIVDLKAAFPEKCSHELMGEIFSFYDRLLTECAQGKDLAVVDDPQNIEKMAIIPRFNMA